jgi:hypothetical protein
VPCYICFMNAGGPFDLSLREQNFRRSDEPVGACELCGVLACYPHGARLAKAGLFRCASCLAGTLLSDAGLVLIGDDDRGEGGAGGREVPGGGPSDRGGPGGAGGPGIREFANSDDFQETNPDMANASAPERDAWREDVESIHDRLASLAESESEQESVRRLLERPGENLIEAAAAVYAQMHRAVEHEVLDTNLLADALGVASWAIGVPHAERPPANRLAMITDRRVQLLLRYAALEYA